MLIKQSEAVRRLGVTRMTLARWERRGIIARVITKRPGAWYDETDVQQLSCASNLVLGQEASVGK